MPRLRIGIFTDADYTWSFEAWRRTVPLLCREYEMVGIYVFPQKLARLKGLAIPFWYLRTFGPWPFLVFGIFTIKQTVRRLIAKPRSWKKLAGLYGAEYQRGEDPNSESVVNWVREHQIDIIFITVGYVLRREIITAPRLGILNKHAALLPSCQGLFPFFWAQLHGEPCGVTIHQVDQGIDTGRLVLQEPYSRSFFSLLQFYLNVFSDFPKLVTEAIRRFSRGSFQLPNPLITASYYGLPTREQVVEYRKRGYCIARLSDLFYEVRGH